MTLAESTIDYYFADIIRGYLALTHSAWMALLGRTPDEATAARDIPDTLPRYGMDAGKDIIYPSIVIAAREGDNNTGMRRLLHVSCYLPTWLKPEDAGAAEVPEQLTRAEASAIQIAIETRLRDRASFYAYLATLDAERLEGWQIMSRFQIATATPQRNQKDRTIDYATTITVTLAVARLVPA
ncbi:hypothetical protein [Prosthecobacter sp.]|uniref:hypothetical protein n=1 Tax=Prosthecobacter sp. TaxID=1965333 RepID=UPI0037831854